MIQSPAARIIVIERLATSGAFIPGAAILPAETDVHSQPLREMNIILNKKICVLVPKPARAGVKRSARGQAGVAKQEVRKSVAGIRSSGDLGQRGIPSRILSVEGDNAVALKAGDIGITPTPEVDAHLQIVLTGGEAQMLDIMLDVRNIEERH